MSEIIKENLVINEPPLETEKQLCQTQCSVKWYNSENINENGDCRNSYERCFTPNESQKFIYNIIDWSKLKNQFENFLKNWIRSDGVKDLFDNLLNVLGTNFATTVDSYKIVNLIKPEQRQCNDINYSIAVTGNLLGSGSGELRLFHIAFHSKEPKVTWGQTRKKYTCGYYQKPEGVAENEGSGEFHYKIDSGKKIIVPAKDSTVSKGKISDTTFNPSNNEQPYKIISFVSNPQSSLLLPNDSDFSNTNFLLSKDTTMNPDTKSSLINNILSIHKEIYNSFITYWNNNVDFQENIKFLSRPAGGKRKRKTKKNLKKKYKKNKQTKRKYSFFNNR